MQLTSWLLALLSIAGLYAAADRPILGFTITLVAQPVWFIYAVATGQWAFCLIAVAYVAMFARLLWKAREKMGYNERDKEALAVWVAMHLPNRVRRHILVSEVFRTPAPDDTVQFPTVP
jgi:hypothetical protein